jgi:hypothetical protein
LDVFLEVIWFCRRRHLSCFRGETVRKQPFIHHARGNEKELAMEPAQVTEIAPNADAPLPIAEKLVVICILIGVALFGLISVVELVTSLFR